MMTYGSDHKHVFALSAPRVDDLSMRRDLEASITLRVASRDDHEVLFRLAALDSARALRGEALLACVDGAPRAALGLADGRVVADPFHHSDDLVDLLRLRATALAPRQGPRRAAA
jgi:hypothetical protein